MERNWEERGEAHVLFRPSGNQNMIRVHRGRGNWVMGKAKCPRERKSLQLCAQRELRARPSAHRGHPAFQGPKAPGPGAAPDKGALSVLASARPWQSTEGQHLARGSASAHFLSE